MSVGILAISRVGAFVGTIFTRERRLHGICVDNRVSGFARCCHSKRVCFALGSRGTRVGTIVFSSCTSELGFRPRDKVGIVYENCVSICRGDKRCRLCISSVRPSKLNTLGLTCRRLGTGLFTRNIYNSSIGGPLPECPHGVNIIASSVNTTIRSVGGVATHE